MLEAHITGPRGSLYYSAPVTPYDLENLRTHVRDAQSRSPREVHVDVTLDRSREVDRAVTALLWDLAARGVAISVA
jgi:hypothetical protein